jgi:hypothetical protein
MPAFLSKNKNQLNTQQANSSRIVTKLRWVVEAINTFLKNSFKALRQVQNKSLPHTHEDYRIAGALLNKYFTNKSNDKQVIKNMKDKLHVDNELQKIVQNELNSKTKFDKLDLSN